MSSSSACDATSRLIPGAFPYATARSLEWAREFAEFYGEGYFAGETSSTMPPLDTLFSPGGTLGEAMDLAASAFGADRTLFVTNGTTGGNSIVYRAIVRPGDLVLLDRNCHKSHHYAAMQCMARVAYMEPVHVDAYGISSIVPLTTITAAVQAHPDATMLVLTHPTFDGLCYDPQAVIEKVHAINPRIVFLFDEAWFAYGAFHPDLRSRSAMVAARRLRERGVRARVFVTQSIHKTLSAMRQASMIHACDPDRSRELELALDEAFIAATTTSPNVHILASLDFARMQAVMEGFDRLSRARRIARWVHRELASESVRVLRLEDLASQGLIQAREVVLDPMKITLHVEGVSGARFRDEVLYGRLGIQTNEYSHNTVLVLVTIGTTFSMADHLVRSLKAWSPSGEQHRKLAAAPIPTFRGFAGPYAAGSADVGDLAKAHRDAMTPGRTRAVALDAAVGQAAAFFVCPYPPGYPILVPGQTISEETVHYLRSLREFGVRDIHGLESDDRIHVLGG